MAKTKTVIPGTTFTQVWEPGDPSEAFAAVSEAGREAKIFMVPLESIHPVADFNIRVHDADYERHIESLKESIKQNGFFRHRPLKVFTATENGQQLFYLADGYSRYQAAKRAVEEGAKIARLPVVPTPKGTSMDDLMIGLDADNDSRPLTPYEKGLLVKRLQANDNGEDEIANKLRISKQYVGDLLSLMSAPKTLHNMVTSGEVAAALAIDMIKEHGSGVKAVEVLKAAGATGEKVAEGSAPATRITRSGVAKTGGTAMAGKRLYEALIEYLVVLNGSSGAQSAMDFLMKWQEKDPEAVKELNKIAKPKRGGSKKKDKAKAKKEPNPKDVRIKITDEMTDEQKKEARAHNKEVKARKERREARRAAREAEASKENNDDPI